MSRVEQIESEIQQMSADELAAFRTWFVQFDADQWDREFEADAASGKLDALAERALRSLENGQATPL
jgi:hypothetical protein